jgi:hypothetical protein
MCFSATASFLTAGVTGAVGIASLARVGGPREVPFATMPIFFAVQQSIEGLLWLDAPVAGGSVSPSLTLQFLIIAEVFWPVYAPIAVLLLEPSKRRRQIMLLCLALGVVVGAHLLWSIMSQPPDAIIVDGHITYSTKYLHPNTVAVAFIVATCLPIIVSSWRVVGALGGTILVGYVVAYLLYRDAFVSVWCFFAAAASFVILFHFVRSRRQLFRTASS